MRKIKRVAASALAVAMATTMVAGCSSSSSTTDSSTAAPAGTTAAPGESTVAPTPSADEGKVLNIYCWNDEYARRLRDHLPGYEVEDEKDALKGGKIGDVKVVFTQVSSDNNAYQDALDAALAEQADAADDDKIDIFLVEADYALKYVDTDATMDVYSLPGLTADDTKDQYAYTQDIMKDSKGVLKGLSWQACPGLMFYNRDIAKEVLGSDDPETVQAAVKDWDAFNATAKKVQETNSDYIMVPSVMDSYRVYQNNVAKPWVVDGKIVIDDNIKKWVDDTKELFEAGYTKNDALWDGYPNATNGNCFAAFGPAWLINFCFGFDKTEKEAKGEEVDMTNVANAGKWGAVVGPQSFYWGGTWMCAATGTDNATLVADIMKKMTCTPDIMKDIVTADDDFVNNKAAMEEMAKSDYSSYILGGMNPLGMYAEGASKISLDNLTIYDQGCNEEFQNAMKNYFSGDSTYEEALDAFYTAITAKYPALSK